MRAVNTPTTALGLLGFLASGAMVVHASDTLYVDDDAPAGGDGLSWPAAYRYLQDALAAAESSGGAIVEIHVAAGTYRPDQGQNQTTSDRAASFALLNGLAVRGGYAGLGNPDPDLRYIEAHESVLFGDLAGDDGETGGSNGENSYHVVTAHDVDATAVLDGFTITSGSANGPDDNQNGGGLYANPGSPTVSKCTFIHNSAHDGGGAYCEEGSITFSDCVFLDNRAYSSGGGLYSRDGAADVQRCRFARNSANYSGGADFYRADVIVSECMFEANHAFAAGGAVFIDESPATVVNCRFLGNSGRHGGAVYSSLYHSGDSQLVNSVFIANQAGYRGGAIYSSGFDHDVATTITNCTIVANDSARDLGEGVYTYNRYNSHCYVANSILWANGGASPGEQATENTNIDYSCIQGGWTGGGGTGIIDGDPLFRLDPEGWSYGTSSYGNVRLAPGSPCLDFGDNDADIDRAVAGIQPLPDFDLDNLLRIVDEPLAPDRTLPPVVDMGAYEYQDDCNGNLILDSVELDAGTGDDCNANFVLDECESQDDCNINDVLDICDMATGQFPDCNLNDIMDECDISSGASQDQDNSGVPDECETALTGYWRMDIGFDVTGCYWFDHYATQVRYLRFDENSDLAESWILVNGEYLKLEYPSTDGFSVNRLFYAGELTANTDRTIAAQRFVSHTGKWGLTELVVVNDGSGGFEYGAEDGKTLLEGTLNPELTVMTGTWEFRESWGGSMRTIHRDAPGRVAAGAADDHRSRSR